MTFVVKSKYDYGDAVEVFNEKYIVVDIEIADGNDEGYYFINYLMEAENRERVWIPEYEIDGKWGEEE